MPFLCLALARKKCVPFKGPSLPQVYLPSFSTTNTGKSGDQCPGPMYGTQNGKFGSFPPWNSSLLPKLYNQIEPCLPHFVDIDITKTASFCSLSCRTSRLNPFLPIFKHFLNISAFKTQPKKLDRFFQLASSKLFTFTHIPETTNQTEMNALRPLLLVLVVLCLLCAHCNLAKPTGSMTRIQEVFRTLMGAKPMMLASRGKKSLVALPNVREFLDEQQQDTDEPSSYWIVADERLPVVAVRLNER